ncbi:MAG: nucleotidyl transferase AbiEii/AbiGii toxin family protein [Bacteroidetes bacterium]|nr:nucleotidyl transferase AbiEii/AbiGii toxin family protein [Bacteroidota bacterium]
MKQLARNIPASVLARLKNLADNDKIDFNFLLLRYLQERLIARVAVSKYSSKFLLKGGLLLVSFDVEKARPTRDIDFLARGIQNQPEVLKTVFSEIVKSEFPDGVQFVSESIKVEVIGELAEYNGLRVKIEGRIGTTRNVIQVDIGFGDIVKPEPATMDYPTILSDDKVAVLAYSRESIIAEKFEAIVKLGDFNSRMKDFYDIVFLSDHFDFEESALAEALKSTFDQRQTSISDANKLLETGVGNPGDFERLWDAFRKRTKVASDLSFEAAFRRIQKFLGPVVSSIEKDHPSKSKWSSAHAAWVRES